MIAIKEWYSAEEKSHTTALHQLQSDIAAVTEGIQALHKAAASEMQSHVKMLEQIAKDMKACSESERAQAQESTKAVCGSILEQHATLLNALDRQGKESANYYKFMIDQPWLELKALSETLQSIGVQVDSILSSIDTIQTDTSKQLKKKPWIV